MALNKNTFKNMYFSRELWYPNTVTSLSSSNMTLVEQEKKCCGFSYKDGGIGLAPKYQQVKNNIYRTPKNDYLLPKIWEISLSIYT